MHHDGKLSCLDQTHGLPLGLSESGKYGHGKVKIRQRDCLVMYTDGVTEAMDKEDNLFGEERLEKVLCSDGHNYIASKITHRILDEVAGFTRGAEPSDDITILVLSYF